MAVDTIVCMAVMSLLVASLAVQETSAAPKRLLLQATGSCNTIIPGCMPNRCLTKVVAGRQQSVCARCVSTYVPSRNGLQCICPPGRYYQDSTRTCVKCGTGFFCKGGKKNADNDNNSSADLGQRQSCYKGEVDSSDTTANVAAKGLTTKTEFAKKHNDCVPGPGWYLSGTTEALQEADLCPQLTYSPGNVRIRRCLRCQSGTAETDLLRFASQPSHVGDTNYTLRSDRFTVCQVPPGSYLVQNVVRPCPAGTFRGAFSRSTDENAKFCFSCPYGITTSVSRATNESACNVIGPGINVNGQALIDAQTAAAEAATNATNGDSVNSISLNASMCDYGTFFEGGPVTTTSSWTCKRCPDGTTTQKMGSASISDCMVPPGYYIKTSSASASATMELCPGNITIAGYQTGFYRAGWVFYNDPSVREAGDGSSACTKCGDGILSTPSDIDESNGGNSSTALVASSPLSCYIQPGWGISVYGQNTVTHQALFRAEICANNSYGVENTTFGLVSAPCKPCQRDLITTGPGATNWTQCVNPAGYGYDPSGAEPCPQGYYAAAGSMLPCTPCPPGRTTNTAQTNVTDCVVKEGHGVFDGDWVPDAGLTDPQLANLTVLPCPIGYFGAGGAVGSICQPCQNNKWTLQEGSTEEGCSVCKPGYGRTSDSNGISCTLCQVGFWSEGLADCKPCPQTNFIYVSSRKPNGREESYNSTGHTLKQGASGQEECVPQTQQFGIDIGQSILNSSLYTTHNVPAWYNQPKKGPTVQECLTQCQAEQCCFVRFEYTFGNSGQGVGGRETTCGSVNLEVNTDASSPWTVNAPNLVFVKLAYADAISAASIKAGGTDEITTEAAAAGGGDQVKTKAMSSGLYSRCNFAAGWDADQVGWPLEAASPVTDAASLQACKSRCDMMSRCWGFTVISQSSGPRVCQLRTGQDERDVRPFFANPTVFNELNWY